MSNPYASQAFAGTEPPPEHLQFDENRLKDWVGGRLPGFEHILRIEKFKGGQSNPTYRIETPDKNYVLRRKPPGVLRPTAHAIDREFRVMSTLVSQGIPVPHPHLYCDDPSVIGSEFYIVDAIEGVIHWNAELPGCTPAYRTAYYEDLIRNLAKIHAVDWKAAGLGDYGKSTGYAARNLDRWYKGFCETKDAEVPDMDWVAATLRERLPVDEPVSLIHGDYGNHNVITAPDGPRVAAILDWEMSTIGNPLVDLAHTMRAWMEPPEPGTGRPTLADKDLKVLGIPSIEENVELYCKISGIPWTDGGFYLAFVMFRYAAIIQGVLRRIKDGTAANKTTAHTPERLFVLSAKAREILEQTA